MKLGIITSIIALFFMTSSVFAADVDGDWNVTMSAAEGATMLTMTITVDGETATATAGEDELTGTYKNGELKLEGLLYIPEAGMSSDLDMTAKLDGDELTGTANWDMYTADVIGTRK